MSGLEPSPEVVVSRPIEPDDVTMELLRKAVAPDPDPGRWSRTSSDPVADIRRAVQQAQERMFAPPVEEPFVVHPDLYAKAQDLLGVHDRPLTNADMWRAAMIEIEQAGIDPLDALARLL